MPWTKPGPVSLDILDTLCSGKVYQSYLIREICSDTGRSSNAVFYALKRLRYRRLVGRRKSLSKSENRCYRWYATSAGRDLMSAIRFDIINLHLSRLSDI